MRTEKVKYCKSLLKKMIRKSLVNSLISVREKCHALKTSPQEPDYIASLTIQFTDELFKILKLLFKTEKFSITGIFCHQKPLADFNGNKNPEIADLLMVYIYTNKQGIKKHNSILFQAKNHNNHGPEINISEEHQLLLYSKWPTFKYLRAGISLNGTERDIWPKEINDGAQFLIINVHDWYARSQWYPMACATPEKKLSLNYSFDHEIVDFITFKSGRTFDEFSESSKDDWSKMIWDLINIAKDKASKRMNSGLKTFMRQNSKSSDGLCYFNGDSNSIFSDLHKKLETLNNFKNDDFVEDENGAVSLILIEYDEQSDFFET